MSTWKRCKCKAANGRELGASCPQLRRADGSYNPDHGTWYGRVELAPDAAGKRRRVKRGGFGSRKAAQAWIDEAKGKASKGVDVTRRLGVADYLAEWLDGKRDIKASTAVSYAQHVKAVWVPTIGRIELGELRRSHVQSALDAQAAGPASLQRYRATLRAALNDAVREGLVSVNVAALVKLPAGRRPKARVWTDARVIQFEAELETRYAAALKRAGNAERFNQWYPVRYRPSPVMVWTPAQVGRFLDHAAGHPLYALFHLIAFRGLRRGEACGLRRADLDLDEGLMAVTWQISKSGGQITEGPLKTDASDATVALDRGTVAVLREHLAAAAKHRAWVGSGWTETPYVFTQPTGEPLDPEAVTQQFERLAFEAGCPPIRLHDLRHTAASLMHLAGADVKTISSTLRHGNIHMTLDTYTSVFEDVDRAAAEATASLVPRAPAPTAGPPTGPLRVPDDLPAELGSGVGPGQGTEAARN